MNAPPHLPVRASDETSTGSKSAGEPQPAVDASVTPSKRPSFVFIVHPLSFERSVGDLESSAARCCRGPGNVEQPWRERRPPRSVSSGRGGHILSTCATFVAPVPPPRCYAGG